MLPNNQTIQSISAGSIIFPHIVTPIRVFIFRDADLRCSLFGLAALCDLGCQVAFTNTTALVTLHVLSGTRIAPASLWTFSLPVSVR